MSGTINNRAIYDCTAEGAIGATGIDWFLMQKAY